MEQGLSPCDQQVGDSILSHCLSVADTPEFLLGSRYQISVWLHRAVSAIAAFESFIVHDLFYAYLITILLPVTCLLSFPQRPSWARRYLDILGIYVATRMAIQLTGLNMLVFDVTTPRFLLITQLLFILPSSLLVWGWVYWRFDTGGRQGKRQLFRLDCEG